jgi:hypothetical protein
MTDNPSISTVPRRTVFQVVQQAGYAGFVWIVRQVFSAMTVAFALFGLFFALLSFGSALPMFSRNVVFHPGMVMWLKAGFVLIVAIYLLWVLSNVMIRFMGRMAERYPILEKIGLGLLSMVLFLLVAGMVYTGWNAKPASFPTPDVTAPQIQALPPDRVLLHMHIATPHRKKLPARTSAALPPPPPWRLWTTTNMVGTAKVKSLGHGRYEIQMIQPPRISRHQG